MNKRILYVSAVFVGVIFSSATGNECGSILYANTPQENSVTETTAITRDNIQVQILYEWPVGYTAINGEIEDLEIIEGKVIKEVNFAVYKVIGLTHSNKVNMANLPMLQAEITTEAQKVLREYYNIKLKSLILTSVKLK